MQTSQTNPAQLKAWEQQATSALLACKPHAARESIEKIAQFFPEYPNIALLQRWAALTEFSWPVGREQAQSKKRGSLPGAVDLVMFHVDIDTGAAGDKVDYLQLAHRSFEAAERKAPAVRKILLTDDATKLPDNFNATEVIRGRINLAFPMFERMRMQEDYLKNRPRGRATVFMDVDIVPNADPLKIFVEDFDIGLTWRGHPPDAPINGGLIFAGPGNKPQKFFAEALRCYQKLARDPSLKPLWPLDLREWWGDQYAWIAMIGYRNFSKYLASATRIDDTVVRFFPCDDYNFTPEPGVGYSPQFLSSRYFLHFKGNRKPMLDWYLDLVRDGKI